MLFAAVRGPVRQRVLRDAVAKVTVLQQYAVEIAAAAHADLSQACRRVHNVLVQHANGTRASAEVVVQE